MDLQTPVAGAGRIFKQYATRLEKLGITKLSDFLYYPPFRYDDYSLISKIEHVQPGETVTIQGVILEIKNQYTKSRKVMQLAKVQDDTGVIDVMWFNQPFLTRVIREGDKVSLAGKVEESFRKVTLLSPDYEVMIGDVAIHTGRLVPIYSETKGISSKWIRRQVYKLLQTAEDEIEEFLPQDLIDRYSFFHLYESLQQIHFPDSLENAEKARQRLSFDELFLLQLSSQKRRGEWEKEIAGHQMEISKFQKEIEKFWEKLPFELTGAQKKAVGEIFKDLSDKKPMKRLLEGDVGSGKTVVSAVAMYLAHLNGYQSVLMAPTEILAGQHFKTISNLLSPLGVKVNLQTSSIKYYVSSIKNKKKENIHNTDVLVGTHAVLNEKIKFRKLGLVVIDEQQRFGVEQRAIIRKKGNNPHLLTMTATPIPRTVALTIYGDLDLSYLYEMPKGRKIVKTWLVPPVKRENAYKWIEKQLKETDSQAFIICPFIEESESMTTVKAATKEFERLKKEVFPNLKLGLLHGKIKGKDKDQILADFKNRKYDILVATPVVEVGIDIPNATIMLIEASERFGLSQLHQLRGRVGRGDKQSYCLLFTESPNLQTINRLKSLEGIHNGAELAELDLKLRGAGDIYGTAQHGYSQMKIASFSDPVLVQKARTEGERMFKDLSKYPKLQEKLDSLVTPSVSPD